MLRLISFSDDFLAKIVKLSVGKVTKSELDTFFSLSLIELKKHYFTNGSESNLLRIIQAQFDIAFFIKECIQHPHQLEILISIANNSNYLTDILVRNPEYFFWVVNPSVLSQPIDKNYYTISLKNTLSAYKSFEAKVNALRNFKRKEILRIGLQDIYSKIQLSDTTRLLADLANSISSALFNICYEEILKKFQIKKPSNKYVIVALGKLGGNELNYSSDIDLIALYDKDSLINKKIYFKQILSESVLLFIETAGQKTGKGFLYRVDFRLRPDGRNAPLCGNYSEYLKYYEMRGEAWEKQMLIKANYMCGSKSLYLKFSEYISNFIFHSSPSLSPFEQIKKLKISIEKRISSDDDIKLSSGGIRDIEFSVQALQLLNGSKNSELRSGNTLKAIDSLQLKGIISEQEMISLKQAYIFFRRIEHYLQLMNDQQTHVIPAKGEIAEKLSFFFGLNEIKLFNQSVEFHRNLIRQFFSSVFESHFQQKVVSTLDEIKFSDKKRANQNLIYLQTGKSIIEKKQFDSRTIESFQKIESELFEYLMKASDPDLVLENFVRVIRTSHYPQIWYDEFKDKKFFYLFLTICEFSQKAIDLFAEDKLLRDEFLSRVCLHPLNEIDLANVSLKTFLFRSAIQILGGILNPIDFPVLYSSFLTKRINNLTLEFAKEKTWGNDFFIAALGSLGADELTFNSDIDLIFVVKGINKHPNVQRDFQNLLKIFRDNLSSLQIDCRLRPEGKSSLLVWDIEDYKKYFLNRVRIWELQSLTKCRFISGNKKLFIRFKKFYIDTIRNQQANKINIEMREMRLRLMPLSDGMLDIKKSSGGLLDIDFLISYFILLNSELISDENSKSIKNIINRLSYKKSSPSDLENLLESYHFLKKVELFNQIIFNTKTSKIPTDEKKLIKLTQMLKLNDTRQFNDKLNYFVLLIKNNFQKIFN